MIKNKKQYLLLILLLGCSGIIIIKNLNNRSLEQQLDVLKNHIKDRHKKNSNVSQADVAWHIDHSLKTINKIYETLETSDPKNYESGYSFSRSVVFIWGDFPRGIAKASKSVQPPQDIITDSLYIQLEMAKQNLIKIKQLPEKAYFKHPRFKNLNRNQTKRFLKIHTKHHLKIIEDILKE